MTGITFQGYFDTEKFYLRYVKRKKVNAELFPDICRNDLIEVNCSSSAWNRLLPFIFQEVWLIILILHLINKVVAALVLI